jgi:putative DNA primase/helicase
MALLQGIVGEDNHTGTTFADFRRPFGLWPLVGKSLAVMSDARVGPRDPSEAVERLLSISGRDVQTVDRKHKGHWTGRLGARVMLVSNELPALEDASAAIAGRFLVWRTRVSHLGREDPGLRDRLLAELPGVLNWALDGLDRLSSQGRFTEPASMAEDVAELRGLASPVARFVDECCALGEGYTVRKGDLYSAWVVWCGTNGERPGGSGNFGSWLRSAAPGVGDAPRPHGGVRTYLGIALVDPLVAFAPSAPGEVPGEEPCRYSL